MGHLIGITGAAGAGKDTAAQALIEMGYRREAFADRMRAAMLALDPWVNDTYGDFYRLADMVQRHGWDTVKREFPEARRLLQKFGTEAGRDIHGTDCWVDLLLYAWEHNDRADTVVTDCRFENEAEAILGHGGHIIKITRPGLEALAGGHSSEAGLPDHMIDAVIMNAGTIEDLHTAVRSLVRFYEETA
jgi:hypothetical protein